MTDDRVAGLPDAGTIQPGDPGHIETHDRMAELMQFAAERIGIILDPPAPKPAVIGEYGHVDAHNTLLANIEQIAREAGTAVGGPPAPILTNPEGGSVVAFTSGGEGAGGPTIAYGAEIEPNDNGETVTVEYDDPLVGGEVSVSGTQPFTDYIVTVYGVNVAGRGESATTDAFQLNYNEATGGDVIDEYTDLSDNTRWRYHQFTTVGSGGTFTVTKAFNPFRVLVVAGGGAGGGGNGGNVAAGGGAGGCLSDDDHILSVAPYPVTVGQGGTGSNSKGNEGQNSTAFGLTAIGGGGGGGNSSGRGGSGGSGGGGYWTDPAGQGTAGQGHAGGSSHNGGGGGGATSAGGGNGARGAGLTWVDGKTYAVGGGHSTGTPDGTGGGGGGTTGTGQKGGSGAVCVAYQIGTSTTRQIEQAKAEAAAREAGYATGYDVGVTDGIEQRDEEIRAAAEEVKEAVKEARPTKDKK